MRTIMTFAAVLCVNLADVAYGSGVMVHGAVFDGPAAEGTGSVASVRFELWPGGSVCLHDAADWADFCPVFSPARDGVLIDEAVFDGVTTNSDGTLRLSLDGSSEASGSVTVGSPPLAWGELYAGVSIHRCEGGDQPFCCVCGQYHETDGDFDCAHDESCAARYDLGAACSCPPLFVRVNWDDDDGDMWEDRSRTVPRFWDDELVPYRALGVMRGCRCGCRESERTHLSGLAASPELRLWSGSEPADGAAGVFSIEAVGATEGIGTGSFRYGIYDVTNGLVRMVTRSVTAANAELRPDRDDNGVIDGSDRFATYPGESHDVWQVRVREAPYLLQLANESPPAMSVSLDAVCTGGTGPALSADADGAPVIPEANAFQNVYVDTSAGAGDLSLRYALGVSAAETNVVDVLDVHVVETAVAERWIPAWDGVGASYDYSDVLGSVGWEVWRETDDGEEYVDGGYGPCFTLAGLGPGDYRVGVYFDGIQEDGVRGYWSCGELHVVDVRLDRLFETSNPANMIFNPTRKDDTSGNFAGEKLYEGTEREERYAIYRNCLYVAGDPTNGAFDVTAKFTAVGAETCTNYYCAFYCRGVKVANSETNVDFNAETVTFAFPATTTEATSVFYQLRGGLDRNGNGTLDDGEAVPFAVCSNSECRIQYAYLRGITKEKYESSVSNIYDKVYYSIMGYVDSPPRQVAKNARSLLAMFFEPDNANCVSSEMRPSETTNVVLDAFSSDASCFAEWLTHNGGAPFANSGVAHIAHHFWDSRSELSEFMAFRTPFVMKTSMLSSGMAQPSADGLTFPWLRVEQLTETGKRLKAFYEDHVRSVAESVLRDAPYDFVTNLPSSSSWYELSDMGTNAVFRSLSPSWVPGLTVEVGRDDGRSGWGALASEVLIENGAFADYDAFGAIGKGRVVNPRYRFMVKKTRHLFGLMDDTYDVVGVRFSCALEDLYDFNFEDGAAPSCAAAVQIGCGRCGPGVRGTRGRVFRHRIKICQEYWDPFEEKIYWGAR